MASHSILKRLVLGVALSAVCAAASAEVVFYSTQARPLEEAQKMRDEVLAGFDGEVQFSPQEDGPFFTRIEAEQKAGEVTLGLLGALHGQFPPIESALEPVDDLMQSLASRNISPTFVQLGKLGTEQQLYIPWMQATYVMAANKDALQYLPEGADINALTYEQLATWAKAMQDAAGEPKLGFPAGPKGLMHRFLQGYLYPSFTDSVVTDFRGEQAESMWTAFKNLWQYVNPRSTAYNFMQEPLLAGEVWVAFDHTARLKDAFDQKPDQFVAFPAPAGPAGRGFMPVVAGLGIPKGTPDRVASATLIEYLTQPDTQIKTLRAIGFYPVVQVELPDDLPPNVKIAGPAVSAQANAADANPSLLPVGLGDQSGLFNKVYQDAFQQIVLREADVKQTLDRQAQALKRIIDKTGAPCWAPDEPSEGPCPVN